MNHKKFLDASYMTSPHISDVKDVHGINKPIPEIIIDHFDIQNYERAIKYLADSKQELSFTNSGKDHATVILSNIFRTSDNIVQMFAGNLKGEVSKGEYLVQLEHYLKRGNFFTLILEKNPETETAAIKIIKQYAEKNSERVKFLIASKESLIPLKTDGTHYHFTIADGRMFRFETDTTNYAAVANFNDPISYEGLKKLFDTLEVSATPYK